MRKIGKKKLIVAGVATAVIAAGAGTALAYWTSSGSGTGSASTSAGASDLSIVQTSTIADLAPGVAPQTIAGTVTNNAPNSAYVNTVTVSIASVTKAVGAPAGTCDASDYTLTDATMDVQTNIASNDDAPFTGAQLSFYNNPTASQDACKGATVNLAYNSN